MGTLIGAKSRVRRALQSRDPRIDQVVSHANVGNLLDNKSSTFEHLAELSVRLGTGHSMDNPLDANQPMQQCVPSRERTERNKHPFTASFNLSKLDHQAI
jgi:hypothetical protein